MQTLIIMNKTYLDSMSLDVSITNTDTIVLQDATSFPKQDGYIRIDDEIIFYATRTDTTLQGCSRGVSGNTKIGDLYSKSNFCKHNCCST